MAVPSTFLQIFLEKIVWAGLWKNLGMYEKFLGFLGVLREARVTVSSLQTPEHAAVRCW